MDELLSADRLKVTFDQKPDGSALVPEETTVLLESWVEPAEDASGAGGA